MIFALRFGPVRRLSWVAVLLAAFSAQAAIDRAALVHRHDIRVAKVDPEASLSVGNWKRDSIFAAED